MQVFHIINAQNESEGGFTIEQLKALPIKPNTLVWYEGLGGWTKASELEVLKPLFAALPPPVPILPPPVPVLPPPIKIEAPKIIEEKPAPVVEKPAPVVAQNAAPQKKRGLNWLQWIGLIVLGAIGLYLSIHIIAAIIYYSTGGSSGYSSGSSSYSGGSSGYTSEQNAVRKNPISYLDIEKRFNTNKLLGGISDGFLSIYNKSNYAFDRVVLRVYYIKSDGGVHKSATVVARNIQGRGTVNEPFPNSDRGTSIRVKVQFVDCSALDIHQEYIVE